VGIGVEAESGSLLAHSPQRYYHRRNYRSAEAPSILPAPSARGYNSFPVTIRASTGMEGPGPGPGHCRESLPLA
jgi:hypothetical protein